MVLRVEWGIPDFWPVILPADSWDLVALCVDDYIYGAHSIYHFRYFLHLEYHTVQGKTWLEDTGYFCSAKAFIPASQGFPSTSHCGDLMPQLQHLRHPNESPVFYVC